MLFRSCPSVRSRRGNGDQARQSLCRKRDQKRSRLKFRRVWTPQLSAGFVKQWAEVEIDGQPVRYDRPIFRISLNNSLRLPAGLLFTLDVRYRSKGDERNLHLTDNTWVVNMGLTRSFFSDRLIDNAAGRSRKPPQYCKD